MLTRIPALSVFTLVALLLWTSDSQFLSAQSNAARTEPNGLSASEIPPEANKYVVLLSSERIGVEGVWKTGDTWHYHFEFNDRGRGPWVDEQVVVDGNGIPVSLDLTGHDEAEKAVADHFRFSGGRATWTNAKGRGETKQAGFYLSAPVAREQIAGVPEELALLARALLRAQQGGLRILPQGEARIQKTNELVIDARGVRKKLTQYAISGFTRQPINVWLEADGTTFAILGDISVLRQGWEELAPRLRN